MSDQDLQHDNSELAQALIAVQQIRKNDFSEIKAFKKPPQGVIDVLEAVSILLGKYPGKRNDWDKIRKNVINNDLMSNILNFDKDHVPHKTLQMLAPLTANDNIHP